MEEDLISTLVFSIIKCSFFPLLGLRAMVNSLLRSLKMLSDVLVLFLFFLCVMALIGLQLFVGQLRHKCVLVSPTQNFSAAPALNDSRYHQMCETFHLKEPYFPARLNAPAAILTSIEHTVKSRL